MARTRNIKPAFFKNDALAEIHPLGRLLFIGLWTIVDFKGCIEYRPKRIKAEVLPYDDCDIEEFVNNLDKSGFISIYSVKGHRYIKINNFERHQNPHKNEKDAGTDCPDISERDCEIKDLQNIEINRDEDGTTPALSLIPYPSSLNPHPSTLKPEDAKKTEDENAQKEPAQKSTSKKKANVEQKLDDIERVFSHWKKVMKSHKSVLDKNRQTLIVNALKNYSIEDICAAIDGCAKSPHHMGENEQRVVYNGLNLILRNAEKIDQFIKLNAGKARSQNESIAQINARITAEVLGKSFDDGKTIDMEISSQGRGNE